MKLQFADTIEFIKSRFPGKEPVFLHEPVFKGNEKKYVNECIDSTFVSSVGKFVDLFEQKIAEYTGAHYAVTTVNGTAALHMSLLLAGVKKDDLVITQPLSFIATCNAISYLSATPLFIDIDIDTLGLSAEKLTDFLEKSSYIGEDGYCYHTSLKRRISACVPMHTFGHPAKTDLLFNICKSYNIALVEDAAESIGSFYQDKHTGTVGLVGAFSFNGNKTITCGGGGVIVTNDADIAKRAKHLTTQAKVPHHWEFVHDEIGYNYRMPNLNAAVACAQLEQLDTFIEKKRGLTFEYQQFFADKEIEFVREPANSRSNYWLNAVILKNREQRDLFLTETNDHGVMTRPVWTLMNKLRMFVDCPAENLDNANFIEERLVNLPSSVRI
jgi:aminotransferase in exopolysaccharide biosynthesis